MLPFFVLGFAWGAVYDVFTAAGKILHFKAFVFIFDVLMTVIFALSFFSLLIGYNGGQIRVLFLAVAAAGFALYLCSVHRVLVHTFGRLLNKFHRFVKKSAKSLKNSKKS